MRRPGRTALLSLLLALTGTACNPGPGPAGGAPQRPPPEVGVVTLAPRSTVLTVELPGRTRPYAVSDVRPQVGGILEARLFEEGSQVDAGQPLYQIDDTRYRAEVESAAALLASAQAALETARLRAERYASLRKEKSISQQDHDDAQAALQQARADVAQRQANLALARINLGYTRITAPIRGRIGRSYLTQGALVTANQAQALASIQTLDPIYVDINQSSSELLSLRNATGQGQTTELDALTRGPAREASAARVTLTLEDGTSYPQEGTLQFSEVVVEPSTGTVTLRAEFPNPDAVLLPGMFVRATVVTGVDADALLVPQRAVSRDSRGNATALVVGPDGLVQLRPISVARTVGPDWLVTGGLTAGEQVIVEGLQYVRPGQPARAVPFAGELPSVDSAAGAPPSSR